MATFDSTGQGDDNGKLLDRTSWRILEALQEDARMPYAEIGRRVGLSAPAVVERIRKLEDAGIITGYRAIVDPTRVGLPIRAIIRFSNVSGQESRLERMIRDIPYVLEAHGVLGNDAFVVTVVVPSLKELEQICRRFQDITSTTTSITMTTPVGSRVIREEMTQPGQVPAPPGQQARE